MKANAWFDSQRMTKEAHGKQFVMEDVLFFHLRKPSVHDADAASLEFDGPAEDRHKKDYPRELQKFLGDNKIVQNLQVVVSAQAPQKEELFIEDD